MCDSILGGCFALVFIILLQLEEHIVLAPKKDEILPNSNLRIRSQLILLVGLKETRFCRKLVWLSIPRAVLYTGLCLKQIQSGAPPPRIPRELDVMSNTHDQVLHGNRYSYLSKTGHVSNIWNF